MCIKPYYEIMKGRRETKMRDDTKIPKSEKNVGIK